MKKHSKFRKTRKLRRRNPVDNIKRFYVERLEDVTGISGAGIVATGTCYPTGRCVMEWCTEIKSLAIYDSITQLQKVHGHGGKTVVRWID